MAQISDTMFTTLFTGKLFQNLTKNYLSLLYWMSIAIEEYGHSEGLFAFTCI